jgi:hypothetical protein
MATIERDLFRLEEDLMNAVGPEGRRRVEALLADDFTEVGASGRFYSRAECIAELEGATGRRILALQDFRVRLLHSDVALVTYEVHMEGVENSENQLSRRSSVWIQQAGGWRIVFHQGTMVKVGLLAGAN